VSAGPFEPAPRDPLAGRTSTGVELRRMARARAVVEARRLLSALEVDDDAGALSALGAASAGMAAALGAYVAGMRDEGASWAAVAGPLGVSRQGAQQRFGSGRVGALDDADEEVRAVVEFAGYDDRAPGKVRAHHVGRLAGYCYQRQHGRCPGHALGVPCSCWCHEPGALFASPSTGDRRPAPEWED
jgi:hypothetical protein